MKYSSATRCDDSLDVRIDGRRGQVKGRGGVAALPPPPTSSLHCRREARRRAGTSRGKGICSRRCSSSRPRLSGGGGVHLSRCMRQPHAGHVLANHTHASHRSRISLRPIRRKYVIFYRATLLSGTISSRQPPSGSSQISLFHLSVRRVLSIH